MQVAGGLIDNVFKGNQAGTKTSASVLPHAVTEQNHKQQRPPK